MPRRRWGVRAGGAKTTFLVRGAQPADNSKGAFEQYPDADQLLTVLTPPPAPVTVAGPANAGQASPAAPEGKSKAGKSKVVALWSRQARGHFKSAVTELRHPFLLTPHEMVFVKHPDQKSTWKRELLSIAHPALARKHPANYDGWKVLIFRPVLGLGSLRDLIHGVGYPLEPFALKYGQQVREHHNVSSARSHLAAQCRWQRCNGNGAMVSQDSGAPLAERRIGLYGRQVRANAPAHKCPRTQVCKSDFKSDRCILSDWKTEAAPWWAAGAGGDGGAAGRRARGRGDRGPRRERAAGPAEPSAPPFCRHGAVARHS